MIKILANNVRDYIKANFDVQYKNFENAFDKTLFNVKMPFEEFSIRVDSDIDGDYNIMYFKKDNRIPLNYKSEEDKLNNDLLSSLDCYSISYSQGCKGVKPIELVQLCIWIYPDGRFYTQYDDKGKYAYEMRQSQEQIELTKNAMANGQFTTVIHSMLFTALLTIQFMHCKNVSLAENEVKLLKNKPKHKKKIPTIKYYTLNIEPLKEILRKEGNIETNGLKKALHICRGHFKTYNEKGLFGKIKGTFWFPQHIKGNIEEGMVDKDYNVKVNA